MGVKGARGARGARFKGRKGLKGHKGRKKGELKNGFIIFEIDTKQVELFGVKKY